MTVLITGGTGFTGAELARTLLKKGEPPFSTLILFGSFYQQTNMVAF
jgi:nucleoside-diphosphate-sugar epimerase